MTTLRFDPYAFERLVVDGIPVHYRPIPWLNDCVRLGIIFHIGARHDPVGKEGLAHFFEHLPFDGCGLYPTFEAMTAVRQKLFMGTLHAHTSFDHTAFYGKTVAEDVLDGMRCLVSMVSAPCLRPIDIERERKVITQEYWERYQNQKDADLQRRHQHSLYAPSGHPYARQQYALGWAETIAAIHHDDLAAFHQKHYHRGNMELLLIGSVDESMAAQFARECAVALASRPGLPAPTPLVGLQPAPFEPHLTVSERELFGTNADSLSEETNVEIDRVMAHLRNPELGTMTAQLLRHLLFVRIRGGVGTTYSPHVYCYNSSDHAKLHIDLSVRPDTEEVVCLTARDILDELATTPDSCRSTYETVRTAHHRNMKTSDWEMGRVMNNSLFDLSAARRVISMTETLDQIQATTYEEVCTLVRTELAPHLLQHLITRP